MGSGRYFKYIHIFKWIHLHSIKELRKLIRNHPISIAKTSNSSLFHFSGEMRTPKPTQSHSIPSNFSPWNYYKITQNFILLLLAVLNMNTHIYYHYFILNKLNTIEFRFYYHIMTTYDDEI